jgi:pimeloyl-ACP methyl ester carboxylesterase
VTDAADLAFAAHREVRANGLRFHVAECGEGDRLALCLHGFPELWISWRHQMPLLARLGWRVQAPDLRGYGGSERPAHRDDYAIEKLMDDVAGLVIMNLPHPGAARATFRTFKQLRRSWYALFFQLPWLPERLLAAGRGRAMGEAFGSARHPEHFPEEILGIYREAGDSPAAVKAKLDYYRAFLRGGGARRQHLLGYPVIETPTLMLWGEHDIALCKEGSFGTDAFVADLTLRYLPDASHWVQQDQPEVVNAMLEAWLAGEPVPEAPPAG